ncbi:MAG TPA: ABC transporter permease [Chloroflexota bacterium]|nr:ABC transporter permease [Chloroflexota bacterium]
MKALWLFHRALLRVLRLPRALVALILQPVLVLWLLCQLFGQLPPSLHSFAVPTYLAFVTPALAVVSALPIAIAGGAHVVEDRESGFLEQVLATPATPAMLLAGELAASALSTLITVPAVVLAAEAAGLTPGGGVGGALALLPLALALNVLYAGLSVAVAALVPAKSTVLRSMGAIIVGCLLISDFLLPEALLPQWLVTLSRLNPLAYAIDGARVVLRQHHSWSGYVHDLLVVAGVAAISVGVALALQARRAEAQLSVFPA